MQVYPYFQPMYILLLSLYFCIYTFLIGLVILLTICDLLWFPPYFWLGTLYFFTTLVFDLCFLPWSGVLLCPRSGKPMGCVLTSVSFPCDSLNLGEMAFMATVLRLVVPACGLSLACSLLHCPPSFGILRHPALFLVVVHHFRFQAEVTSHAARWLSWLDRGGLFRLYLFHDPRHSIQL